MSQPNGQIKKHIALLSAICGTLLLSTPAIAQTTLSEESSENPASSEMCVPNTDGSRSPAEGTSSVNSNRNTPTTDRDDNDNDNDRDTDNDNDNSRTTEGTSSANSNRNTPTTETSGRVREQSSTRRDSAGISDRNNTSASAELCDPPSSSSPSRDKQIRRDNYQPTRRIIPPTPEQQQAASAMVRPANGMVNIKLVNETGANIVYEAIGETNQRNLQGQTSITLQRLDTPSTITFFRTDGGLLRVSPQAVAPGVLEVRFAATTNLGIDKNSLTVQPSGAVYLN